MNKGASFTQNLWHCDEVLISLQKVQRVFVHPLLNAGNFYSFVIVYQPYDLQHFLSLKRWDTMLVLFKSTTTGREYTKHANDNQMRLTQAEWQKNCGVRVKLTSACHLTQNLHVHQTPLYESGKDCLLRCKRFSAFCTQADPHPQRQTRTSD